jgi:hypothetical protein
MAMSSFELVFMHKFLDIHSQPGWDHGSHPQQDSQPKHQQDAVKPTSLEE